MNIRFVLAALLSLALVSGCAISKTSVSIDYVPATTFAANDSDLVNYRISVGEIEDMRRLEDPNVIIHKTNNYGDTTSGAYVAEKPVASIVRDALAQFFEDPDSGSGASTEFEISGKLVKFKFEAIPGWLSSEVNSEMSVQLYMRDLDTGKIVWNESFLGRGHIDKYSKGWAAAIDMMLSEAIDDLLVQIQSSEVLSTQLAAHSQPGIDNLAVKPE